MRVTVIGTGFVGVVTAAVFASFGNEVYGLDIDESKVASLREGKVPFYEPGLEELLIGEQKKGSLTFTTDYAEAIPGSEVIIIAVGTPSTPEGEADLSYVYAAAKSLSKHLDESTIVVVKSTVPPGTLDTVEAAIKEGTKVAFHMASVPEFLREGSAVIDTLNPSRVVLGATNQEVFAKLEFLHAPLQAPVVKVSPESAQLAKYAANAYLATRITFINQVADLCEHSGANVDEVIEAIGYDERIGNHYWYPGFGYGGSCFPKDVKELAYYSREIGLGHNLFNKLNELNEERIPLIMAKIERAAGGWAGKKVAVLGLAFKPNTDDMREAPSLKVIPILLEKGASVVGYDPRALDNAKKVLGERENLSYSASLKEAAAGADAIFALIEWPDIVGFDYVLLREEGKAQVMVDARNQLDKSKLEAAGYIYVGIGR